MTSKPNSRNWNDVQMAITAIALVTTLSLWNLFAGPDRVKAVENQNAQTAPVTEEVTLVAITPTLEPVKIMLGGAAPSAPSQSQPQASAPPKPRGGGGGSSGGGGTTGGGGGGTGGS